MATTELISEVTNESLLSESKMGTVPFLLSLTYDIGAQRNRPIEIVILSAQNIFFGGNHKIIPSLLESW